MSWQYVAVSSARNPSGSRREGSFMTFPASARLAWHSPAVSSGGSPRETVEGLRGSLKPRILYATPEMADFVKTGGLGEVAASLPRCPAPCASTMTCAS